MQSILPAQGSCHGHPCLAQHPPKPMSPRALQHPSPWQHIFHILRYLLSLWSVLLAAPGTLHNGSRWEPGTHLAPLRVGGES